MLLKSVAAALVPAFGSQSKAHEHATAEVTRIATNTYPWLTFARRAQQTFEPHTEPLLSGVLPAGVQSLEFVAGGGWDGGVGQASQLTLTPGVSGSPLNARQTGRPRIVRRLPADRRDQQADSAMPRFACR